MSKYLCLKCHEIYDFNKRYYSLNNIDYTICPKTNCLGKVVEIDELMLPIIIKLNKLNFKTTYCCSGHYYDTIPDTYVSINLFDSLNYHENILINDFKFYDFYNWYSKELKNFLKSYDKNWTVDWDITWNKEKFSDRFEIIIRYIYPGYLKNFSDNLYFSIIENNKQLLYFIGKLKNIKVLWNEYKNYIKNKKENLNDINILKVDINILRDEKEENLNE